MHRLGYFIRTALSGKSHRDSLLNIRAIHRTVALTVQNSCNHNARAFVDTENAFAHNVLEQSLKPYQIFRFDREPDSTAHSLTTAPLRFDPPEIASDQELSLDELFRHYEDLIRFCVLSNSSITDPRYRPLLKAFCERSNQLSDDQLLESLRLLGQLPGEESVRAPNFIELWNSLDVVCCERIESWDSDRLLLVCDAWYALHLARICEFVWEALRKLGRKVARMRPEQLVQAMFLFNVLRKPVFEMFDFEVNLRRCAHAMSLPELGVLAMGFFKTQTPIRNPELLEHLYRRLIAEIDTVEDITLVSLLKVLRYSTKLPQADLLVELLDALCGQVERISLLGCLHVALMGCEFQLCHDDVIERVLQRFNRDVAQSRLKDLERVSLVLGLFNYRSASGVAEELCAKILALVRTRVDEIVQYPRCFPNMLQFLTFKGHADPELISTVLDKRFMRHAYGANVALGRAAFYLDAYSRINLGESAYEGNRLEDKMRRTMGKLLTQYIPERNTKYKLNATDRMLLEIKEAADCFFRPHCALKHVLPHFERADVVVCYDRRQRCALPLSPNCSRDYTGDILRRVDLLGEERAGDGDLETIVVTVAGWNNVLRGKNTFCGPFEMKLQQLRLLGHKTVVIPWYDWREQETAQDRQRFLQRKLAAVVSL